MAADVKNNHAWPQRIKWFLLGLTLIVVVAIVTLRIFITTASGARFIETQVNKRSFGAIERLHISGLSGDPLTAISIESLIIKDKEGVWLKVQDIDMTWKPLAFFKGHVWIESLSAKQIDLLRKPVLNESKPGGLKTTLESFIFPQVNLSEDLPGQMITLGTSGQFVSLPSGVIRSSVHVSQLDAAGDSFALDFSKNTAGEMEGIFDIKGAPEGFISDLIKAPEDAQIIGAGSLRGDQQNGEGAIEIKFDETTNISGNVNWTAESIKIEALTNLINWPIFDPLRSSLGDTLKSRVNIDRTTAPQTFTANINVPGLALNAEGAFPETGYLPARANIDLKVEQPSNFFPLPQGYQMANLSAKGRANLQSPLGFDGMVSAEGIKTPFGTTASIAGPIAAAQTGDDIYDFKTDLNLVKLTTPQALPFSLSTQTKLKTAGALNPSAGRVSLSSFYLRSGRNSVSSTGNLKTNGQAFHLSGRAAALINAQGTIPEGALEADYKLIKSKDSRISIRTDGAFHLTSKVQDPFGGLIGEQLLFKADLRQDGKELRILNASISSDNVKTVIQGQIGEQLNLTGEALILAPLEYNNIKLDKGTDASFLVAGTSGAPTLRLDASSNSVTFQDNVLKPVRLRTELSDILDAPKGPIQINAETQNGALSASAQMASKPGIYVANDINITLGDFSVGGDLSLDQDNFISGGLKLHLPENEDQYARAEITLDRRGQDQGIALNIDARRVSYLGLNFDTLSVNSDGSLAALTGQVKAAGRQGNSITARPFKLNAPISLSRDSEQVFTASISPDASYGNVPVTSAGPITAVYNKDQLVVDAILNVANGRIDVAYQRGKGSEILRLKADSLPVTLIPMPGNLADTRGLISMGADLTAQIGGQLQGSAVINLFDWRGFDVKKGEGLTGELRIDIIDQSTNAVLTASSPAGFKTNGKLRLPLEPSTSVTSARLDMNASISGTFSASGAAASVMGLFTPSDAELAGNLSTDIAISGTAENPHVEGQAGGKDIQLESPELGTRLRQGRFAASFTQDSLTLRDLFFADSTDGSITGTGEFKLGARGRPIGKIDMRSKQFRALDRRDVKAKVSGALEFQSGKETAGLSGNVTLDNVEIKQFANASVSVIEIDVEEINRPAQDAKIELKSPTTPIDLNIGLLAPRRIFVRSRGIDMEMSIDATIKGTTAEPLFYGNAKVIRGGYKLAGKTLEFENGMIVFDGDLTRAKVAFKAVTDTQNLQATVEISGTVNTPEITLSSVPVRPQDEILSALLFGQSATELSALEAAQLAGALAQLSGKGSGLDLLGGLRNAIGFNQLSVNLDENGGAQLVGGKYLANNVYLQVFSGSGPDQTGAIIDWEIRKNIALSSRIRSDNDQTLSLKWKKDF